MRKQPGAARYERKILLWTRRSCCGQLVTVL
jgi:hypothetical protein